MPSTWSIFIECNTSDIRENLLLINVNLSPYSSFTLWACFLFSMSLSIPITLQFRSVFNNNSEWPPDPKVQST